MKLTYIHHSSFCIEAERANILFDYFEGEVPPFAADKPLYIFSSHRHGDHFSEKVFSLAPHVKQVTYLLSSDIPKGRVPEGKLSQAQFLDKGTTSVVDGLTISTFKSTDEGLAFVIGLEGKTVYYAGDLNNWHWEGEPDDWNAQMEKDYLSEVAKLPTRFDLAFVPVDPRLGASFSLGAEQLLAHASVSLLVPMHFWDDFTVCQKLQAKTDTKVLFIEQRNQTWRIS